MKTKTIRQTLSIHTSAREVFEMLMDEKKHALFTGSLAQIDRNVGGKFSTNDGYSTGTNLELFQDNKIVQTWRAGDWPKRSLFNTHYHTFPDIFQNITILCPDRSPF
jgi:activator of HSP90 ATPase